MEETMADSDISQKSPPRRGDSVSKQSLLRATIWLLLLAAVCVVPGANVKKQATGRDFIAGPPGKQPGGAERVARVDTAEEYAAVEKRVTPSSGDNYVWQIDVQVIMAMLCASLLVVSRYHYHYE